MMKQRSGMILVSVYRRRMRMAVWVGYALGLATGIGIMWLGFV